MSSLAYPRAPVPPSGALTRGCAPLPAGADALTERVVRPCCRPRRILARCPVGGGLHRTAARRLEGRQRLRHQGQLPHHDSPELNRLRRQPSGITAKQDLWEVHYDPYDVSRVWVRPSDSRRWIEAITPAQADSSLRYVVELGFPLGPGAVAGSGVPRLQRGGTPSARPPSRRTRPGMADSRRVLRAPRRRGPRPLPRRPKGICSLLTPPDALVTAASPAAYANGWTPVRLRARSVPTWCRPPRPAQRVDHEPTGSSSQNQVNPPSGSCRRTFSFRELAGLSGRE